MSEPSLEAALYSAGTRDRTKAVVLFSGGQDSTTVLHFAMKKHGAENVFPLAFNYGQRHAVELEQARLIALSHGLTFDMYGVPSLRDFGPSALHGEGDVSAPHVQIPKVPASFVPGRNAFFLLAAYNHAIQIGARAVYGGMCETDYSGYPDCRNAFVRAMEQALQVGYPTTAAIQIRTPLMWLNKAETFRLAQQLGDTAWRDVIDMSHTCYEGDHTTKHEWGYGCGECPACKLRAAGYAEFKRRYAA